MSPRWRDAAVAFARVEISRVYRDRLAPWKRVVDYLANSLVPGTTIERYGRVWRMGQVRSEGRVFVGRIGYERPGEIAELWDSETRDFKETRLREGLTSPFALSNQNLVVVFQLRAGRIKANSFTGAFQALLNEAIGRPMWRVQPLVVGEDWLRWQSRVDRIDRVEVRVERPNPNYHGRGEVERIVEGTRSRLVKMIFDARDDELDGLNVDDPLIREAIEHALDDHGNVKAVGEVDGEQTVWRSEREGAPVESRVPIDERTREARPDALRWQVQSAAPPPDETDDEDETDEAQGSPPRSVG
jgi:hypothetical protein